MRNFLQQMICRCIPTKVTGSNCLKKREVSYFFKDWKKGCTQHSISSARRKSIIAKGMAQRASLSVQSPIRINESPWRIVKTIGAHFCPLQTPRTRKSPKIVEIPIGIKMVDLSAANTINSGLYWLIQVPKAIGKKSNTTERATLSTILMLPKRARVVACHGRDIFFINLIVSKLLKSVKNS